MSEEKHDLEENKKLEGQINFLKGLVDLIKFSELCELCGKKETIIPLKINNIEQWLCLSCINKCLKFIDLMRLEFRGK